MKSMAISEFKAKCIAVLKHASRTGTPLLVTHRGTPLVRIEPVQAADRARILGDLAGKVKIRGDIVHADFSAEWEPKKG